MTVVKVLSSKVTFVVVCDVMAELGSEERVMVEALKV
jgi:hypothetical protein